MKTKYNNKIKITLWILQGVSAFILLQTLYFKFTGAPESIDIFTKIGAEPFGRYATGIAELIAGILLLSWRLSIIGAIISLIIILGAIYFHITLLGINSLFYLALIVLISCISIIYLRRKELKFRN